MADDWNIVTKFRLYHEHSRLSDYNSADIATYIYRLHWSRMTITALSASEHALTKLEIDPAQWIAGAYQAVFTAESDIHARLRACNINYARVYPARRTRSDIDQWASSRISVRYARALMRPSHRAIRITRFRESTRRKLDTYARYRFCQTILSHDYFAMLNFASVKPAREEIRTTVLVSITRMSHRHE